MREGTFANIMANAGPTDKGVHSVRQRGEHNSSFQLPLALQDTSCFSRACVGLIKTSHPWSKRQISYKNHISSVRFVCCFAYGF